MSSLKQVATAAFAGVLFATGLGAYALAAEDFMGSWSDNIAGEMRVGQNLKRRGRQHKGKEH